MNVQKLLQQYFYSSFRILPRVSITLNAGRDEKVKID